MKQSAIKLTEEIISAHGLTPEEYKTALSIMGREPNLLELGIFSVMWSEHCSYKSTRIHLRKFKHSEPWVICGPGENAGVIDIGDNQAAIFKIESHNHPSYIEPYQGAATGVGGIMRDIFTMGARPVANLNALRFGSMDFYRTRHLLTNVVAGIGGYGNCVGVPTIGGECSFHKSYNGNILVNAMTIGIAEQNKIFYSKAAGVGNPVIYVGSKTGRDGIHGATMASAEFDDKSEEKRPTVQVGDPFAEKLLIEACLELMKTDAIISIQDMGAAGLTCSSLEMASKGELGIELHLEKVPVREEEMTPYEIMLSESQERMLIIIKPECEEQAFAIFRKWELDFAKIGHLTDTGRLVLKMNGEVVGDMPVAPLSDQAPLYNRPFSKLPKRPIITDKNLEEPSNINQVLSSLLSSPEICSKKWIWEQYDHRVMNNTILAPGADAGIVRIAEDKAIAATTDCTPRYCLADPFEGGKQAVAEGYRNITATGATPLAITNCLNFGNPEKPEVMAQIVGAIEGIAEASRILRLPVISGNVSLYNETNGNAIMPTPTIGTVGIMRGLDKIMTPALKNDGDMIVVVGETKGHIGMSVYLREYFGQEDGMAPAVDLYEERKNGDFVRELIDARLISACHDISDGGLYVALAEMAIMGNKGAKIAAIQEDISVATYLFAEDQGRYIITVKPSNFQMVKNAAIDKKVAISTIGEVGGNALMVNDSHHISIKNISDAYHNNLEA